MTTVSVRQPIEIDWEREKGAFVPDGSLRDLYVLETTIDDWRAVVAHFESGPYGVRFTDPHVPHPVAPQIERLFAAESPPMMFVTVDGILLVCHFFAIECIELDLDPSDVSASNVRALFELMVDLGELTGRVVVLTPENCPEDPRYRYARHEGRLTRLTL